LVKLGKETVTGAHRGHTGGTKYVKIQVAGQAVKLRSWKMVRNIDK
jgi:hypothetical protein